MPKLYYFQAPNFDINPESDTAPKLGSIFSSLDRLTGPLNQFDYASVPTNLMNQSASAGFNETVDKSLKGSMGLNANVAQGIAGSADLVYAFARAKKNVYHCELLETVEFEPTEEFVSDCILASQRVQNFLENSLVGRKRVYMITGLKIATGFSMSASNETKHNPILKVAVNMITMGVPAEAGPKLDLAIANARTVSHGRSTNKIVFAYRVIRIKRKRDGEPRYKYKSGGKYAVTDDSDEEDVPWDVEPLDEEDRLKDFPDSVMVEMEDESSPWPGGRD